MAEALVPLSFAPGEAYQYDWSHEVVLINGTRSRKVAHVRLCHSRMLCASLSARDKEMVFDAHNRAFAFFKGACTRGIYDNMKTAVETVFIGKDRQFNRRFLRMCGHYLVEPTPARGLGLGKGQVENQVGVVRERFFTPRLRVASYEELNAWLLDRCVAYAKAHKHPELDRLHDWQAFEAERPQLADYGALRRVPRDASLGSKTCLVRFDNNKYSVASRAVGGPVEIQAYADRILIRQEGAIVASIAAGSAAARRSTIPGITSRCSPGSQAPCVMAPPSRTGSCRPAWSVCGVSCRARMMATTDGQGAGGAEPTAWPLSRRPAPRPSPTASIPPTSFSTSFAAPDPGPVATILTPDALRLRHAADRR